MKTFLEKEKKRVQQLKKLYVKELEYKSVYEQILRKCIEDVKDGILKAQREKGQLKTLTKPGENTEKAEKISLLEKLINEERILTLIYDNAFHSNSKKIEIPKEVLDEEDNML